MIIGIDYDGTFTADPGLWADFVRSATARGHQCVCVTGRSDEGEYAAEVRRAVGSLMPVVFASMCWKKKAAAISGYEVDVWIDDMPEMVAEQTRLLK